MIERIMQKDLLMKIAALVIALVAWSQVMLTENPFETKVINVNLVAQVSPDMVLTQSLPARVALTLEGRRRTLAAVNPEDEVVSIDLTKLPAGTTTVPIEHVSPNAGVTVIDVNPPTITVPLMPQEDKVVAVDVRVKGTPNKEFTADKPVFSVQTVKVTGPRSNVERIQGAVGEIDVTGAVGDRTAKVSLAPLDAYGDEVAGITVEPAEIDVTVPMKAKDPAVTVPVKVETTGTPKKGYKLTGVTVLPESVEIRGPVLATSQIRSLVAKLNIEGRDAGFSTDVSLTVPSGVSLESSAKVEVTVAIAPDIITKKFSRVVVQLENLPIEFTFAIIPTEVEITLEGRTDVMEQVKAADVQAFINAIDIDPKSVVNGAEYPLPVYLGDGLPTGIKVVDISHKKVILVLTKR